MWLSRYFSPGPPGIHRGRNRVLEPLSAFQNYHLYPGDCILALGKPAQVNSHMKKIAQENSPGKHFSGIWLCEETDLRSGERALLSRWGTSWECPLTACPATCCCAHSVPDTKGGPGCTFQICPKLWWCHKAACHTQATSSSILFSIPTQINVFADLTASSPEPASGLYLGKMRGFSKLRSQLRKFPCKSTNVHSAISKGVAFVCRNR